MGRAYLGGFITKSPRIPSSSSASGIWTTDQAMQYIKPAVAASSQFDTLASTAQIWLSASSLSGVADNTQITSWTNKGAGGSAYDATIASSGPKKVTYNSYPALQFDDVSYLKLDLANEITVSSGSLFMVGYQTTNRIIALGGSSASSSGNCFYGFYLGNNTGFLFRDTSDSGLTLTGLSSVAGLKSFGVIKNGTTSSSYFDNSTTQVSSSALSGTFKFGRIGVRDYLNTVNGQKSIGYLTEILYFNTALSTADAQTIMTGLKSRYGIA